MKRNRGDVVTGNSALPYTVCDFFDVKAPVSYFFPLLLVKWKE